MSKEVLRLDSRILRRHPGICGEPGRDGRFFAMAEAIKPSTRVIPVKTGIQAIPARAGIMQPHCQLRLRMQSHSRGRGNDV